MPPCIKKSKKGFTLIEVVLVIGLTGLVLVGLLSGINFNIARQRYNDSVQDFAEFLRRVYSEAANVENPLNHVAADTNICTPSMLGLSSLEITTDTRGRSNCAFYGKLISFGEDNPEYIYVYDVIGKAYSMNSVPSGSAVGVLKSLYADILTVTPYSSTNLCTVHPFSTKYRYYTQYGATIEKKNGNNFTGMVLIARSPATNSLHTFFSEKKLVNAYGLSVTGSCNGSLSNNSAVKEASLREQFNSFQAQVINFCVASTDIFAAGNTRRNVRIDVDGNNASAVRLINTDVEEDDFSAMDNEKAVSEC